MTSIDHLIDASEIMAAGAWVKLSTIVNRRGGIDACKHVCAWIQDRLRTKQIRYRYRVGDQEEKRCDDLPDIFWQGAEIHWAWNIATFGDWTVQDIELSIDDSAASSAKAKPTKPLKTKEWITDAVARRRERDDLPDGITKFSRQLHTEMIAAREAGQVVNVIGARRIEAVLRDTRLWPQF